MNLESGVLQVHVEDIIPNRFQPRLNFDEQGLKDNGVTSMIKATNKITLIVGTKSSELEKFIEENKRPE